VNESAKYVVTMDVVEWQGSGGYPSCGHVEVDTSMRSLPVVVADVLPKDSLEMATAEDERPVEATLSETVLTQRSAKALARGD